MFATNTNFLIFITIKLHFTF